MSTERTANEARRLIQLTKDVTFDSARRDPEELEFLEDCAATLLKNIRAIQRGQKALEEGRVIVHVQ